MRATTGRPRVGRGRGTTTAAAGRSAPGRATLLLAALLALGCGSTAAPPPRPTAITPDHAAAGVPTAVRIRGEGFGAQVGTDFAARGGDVVDARFQARLGATPLADVVLRQDGALEATAPADLPPGTHDLTVIDPAGRAGTLARAFRVLAVAASGVGVARFRVDPVGPQVAFAAFPVSIAALDPAGAVATDFTGQVQLSDLTGTAVPSTLGPFVNGRWSGAVEVRAARAGDVLTATGAGGAAGASDPFDVAPAPPVSVAFTSTPPVAQAGGCVGPVTLSLRDEYGFATAAAAPLAVALLATPAAGLTLFSDPGCTSAVSGPTIAAGQGTVSLWFVATVAGPLSLSATAAALAGDVLQGTVTAGPPAALAFVTPARTATAGACSAVAMVEVRDAWGNPAPGGATLTADPAPASGLTLFSDPCATPAGSLTVPAGATTASLWFRGTAAGVVRVSVSGAGVAAAAQDETVTAGPAGSLVFASAARATAAGACSAPLVLEARDAFGNPALAAAAIPLAASASLASGFALYADAACATPASGVSLAAGAGTVSLHYRGTVAGDVAVDVASALGAASQTERVVPAAPAAVVFTSAPQTLGVMTCSAAASLAVIDAYGNAAPVPADLALALAAPGGTGLFSDPACAVPVAAVTVPAGTAGAAFFFRATAVGTIDLAASAANLSPAAQSESVIAGTASQLAFGTTPQVVAAGACSGVATVRSEDAFGNLVSVSGTSATAITLSAPGLALYADPTCSAAPVTAVSIPAGATTASFRFRGTTAASATVTATSAGLSGASQTETVTPAAAAQLVFTSTPLTVIAGTCSGPVTIESRDAWGNTTPVSGALPTTILLSSGLALHTDAACATVPVTSATLAAGAASVTVYFSGTTAGAATVTAGAAGLTSSTQTENVSAAAASQVVFTSAPLTVTTGACSAAVTLQSRDAHGNPSPLSNTAASAFALSAPGLTLYADATCSTAPVTSVSVAATASTTAFYFRGTAAGPAVVTASATGVTSASQTETLVAASANQLAFATAAQSVTAGSCSGTTTVEALDAYANPTSVSSTASATVSLSATGLSFYAGAGCSGAAVTSIAIPAGASASSFSFRGTTAGSVRITASAAGLAPANQDETITAGPTDHYAWATIASPELEGVAFAVTITAVDAYGNRKNYSGTVTLAASQGTVSCASACTSATETSAFTAGQWAGTIAVTGPGYGRTLTATGSTRSGISNAFDVRRVAVRSPPIARFTVSARVVASGTPVTFDASGSTDDQTPLSSLSVSWHLEAQDADFASAVAPPTAPWTAWSTTKTVTHTYSNATGAPVVYRPRLAVRDTEAGTGGPDVGYASGPIVVLPDATHLCIVDTDSLVDDAGAGDCTVKGPDGRTSLPEALRVAAAYPALVGIAFSGTRNLVSAGGTTLSVAGATWILANPRTVVLDGVSLSIDARVLVAGLELVRLRTPLTISLTGDADLEDLHVHDGQGLEVQGKARVLRARMSSCAAGPCVRESSYSAFLALLYSDLTGNGTGSDVGVALDTCAFAMPNLTAASPYLAFLNGWSDTGSAFVGATTFTGFGVAVTSSGNGCPYPVVANTTFHRNGTGVRIASGFGGYLLNDVFTGQTVAAVDPAFCAFTQSASHLAWQNAANGCLTGTPGLLAADPLYLDSVGGDLRIDVASPARDSGSPAYSLEADDAGPGLYLGAGPDRGGRETY